MTSSIGLVELPQLGLLTANGSNLLAEDSRGEVLISKQVLLASLQGEGFDAQLIDLKNGDYQTSYGTATWRGNTLDKIYYGQQIESLDPTDCEAWGITNNFSQHREIACATIKHLASKGRPVVVGGSDAIAQPQAYLAAGAAAIVLDKSGAANAPIMDYVLGNTPREELSGVILAQGSQPPPRAKKPLSPENWHLPSLTVAQQCLGTDDKKISIFAQPTRIGSIFTDIGCDRHCDFCQTPNYRLGYRAMSPQTVEAWLKIQKQAGAQVIINGADQFLGRIVQKGGREDILEIMRIVREQGMPILWPNGLELKKTTLGRGINRKSGLDFTPDEELINALWGWDGKVGCYMAYIPAERPVFGQENYSKLLPWQEHCEIIKTIVRTHVPYIRYGVIIGFADDNHETLCRLEEAIWELYEELMQINPALGFQVAPFALSPIPGTGQAETLRESGLIRIDDPNILGGIWTPGVDTQYLSYGEIADWQQRLTQIGRSRYMTDGRKQ